jgi:hypothetical protein
MPQAQIQWVLTLGDSRSRLPAPLQRRGGLALIAIKTRSERLWLAWPVLPCFTAPMPRP